MLKPHDLVVEISQLHHEGRQRRARFNGPTISTSQLVRFDVSPRNPFADFLVELRGFKPRCSWRCLRVTGASLRRLLEGVLESEAFAIPESQRDAVAEGVEKVILAVTFPLANAKALDLIEQMVS
jgi:hypothetical protein